MLILSGLYEATAEIWRPDMDSKMWIMWITAAIFALLFVHIFSKGYEGKGLMEGARFGLWIGLLLSIPMGYNTYAIFPIPYSLVFLWFLFGTIQVTICGIVAACLYKSAAKVA